MKINMGKEIGWVEYSDNMYGINIESFTYEGAGYIKACSIYGNSKSYKASNQKELINVLKEIASTEKYKVIIWTDNIDKTYGFLQPIISYNGSAFNFEVLDKIEFRDISQFDSTVHTAIAISQRATALKTSIFDKEGLVLTVNQLMRKRIKKSVKSNNIAKTLFPKRYQDYLYIKKSIFGGFYTFKDTHVLKTDMLGLDLVSAYIYCILCKKHFVTEFEKGDPDKWLDYIKSDDTGFIGTFTVEYTAGTNRYKCYSDIFGDKLDKTNKDTRVTIRLTHVDVRNMLDLGCVTYIKCIDIKIAKLDYLPKEICDIVIDQFKLKNEMKLNHDDNISIQKAGLNGIYGSMIQKRNDKDEFLAAKKNAFLAPQWGSLVCSYCKDIIIHTGIHLDDWSYSNTDSIYCKDNDYNREIIAKKNFEICNNVMDMCDRNSYNFNEVSTLGMFKLEATISKFKVFRYGLYAYTDEHSVVTVKASSCNKEQIIADDSIYDLYEVPVGTRVYGEITKDKTSCTIDGKTYTSNGSYYEYETHSSVETLTHDVITSYRLKMKS